MRKKSKHPWSSNAGINTRPKPILVSPSKSRWQTLMLCNAAARACTGKIDLAKRVINSVDKSVEEKTYFRFSQQENPKAVETIPTVMPTPFEFKPR
mmetsp:Transcript_38521/g.57745  ORF Transcript_38521/g.57745 Transcript_38521/m.57745 type:complete len:96 (+) Transcript_38521:492-779(+)